MATTDAAVSVSASVAAAANVNGDAIAVNDTVMNCQADWLPDCLTVHPAAHPDRPPHPSSICGPLRSHSHSPICWSWPCWCWCWCWCCIDMQLTEPRDGFESGMGQLTQRDLFYRRMHFLWLNDSWSFLNAATAVNQPTNPRVIPSSLLCLQNNWTIGSCQWGSAPKKEDKSTAPHGSAEIYS